MSAGVRSYVRKLWLKRRSIRIPHFSQVTSFVGASVTATLYFAPQTHVCVPVSHSTNSVMLRICAPTHSFSSELSWFSLIATELRTTLAVRFAPRTEVALHSTTRSAPPGSLALNSLLSRSNLTGSALLDAPFSDGGRAGTKPNGFEL